MGVREWFLFAKVMRHSLRRGADVYEGKISREAAMQETTDMLLDAAGVLPPVPLKNMIATEVNLKQHIAGLQETPPRGDLTHIRTYLMSYYGHLMQGGDPVPSPSDLEDIVKHPEYARLIAEYPALQEVLAALELARLGGVFGYKMADESILPPDINWLPEQWKEVREKSIDKTARLWIYDTPPTAV